MCNCRGPSAIHSHCHCNEDGPVDQGRFTNDDDFIWWVSDHPYKAECGEVKQFDGVFFGQVSVETVNDSGIGFQDEKIVDCDGD